MVLAQELGDWLKLELTLSVALPQALLLAAEDALGRADALALDELLSLRTLLSVPARVAVPVAHGVAELVISARLAVGADERETLLLTEVVLLVVADSELEALELAQRLGPRLPLAELLAQPLKERLALTLAQVLEVGLPDGDAVSAPLELALGLALLQGVEEGERLALPEDV